MLEQWVFNPDNGCPQRRWLRETFQNVEKEDEKDCMWWVHCKNQWNFSI
jgi:hypothetical protein